MVAFDAFRQDLAASLRRSADRRRSSCASGPVTGEDLKVIALLERLANDVKHLDLHVFLVFELMFTDKALARRFIRQREDLMAQIGVLYCPSSATDLVRWLAKQAVEKAGDDRWPGSRRAAAILAPLRGPPGARRRPADVALPASWHPWASDFSAGIGIVAPLLSLWYVRQAFGQLHDRSIIAAHAAVPATVVSVDPAGVGKSAGSTSSIDLAFQPTAGTTCHVMWHTGSPVFARVTGETLPVVPRSSACEMPVIPSELADPVHTFLLAGVLMATGLIFLTLWTRLFRRSAQFTSRAMSNATAAAGRRSGRGTTTACSPLSHGP